MAGFGDEKVSQKKAIKGKFNKIQRGEYLLKSGINYHAQGDLEKAEINYRQALKIGYFHSSILANLGIICKNSERLEEAILLYKKAIDINPNEAAIYSNLGSLYQIIGNFESAVECTKKSIQLRPNNPQALLTLGWSNRELGNLDEALASTLKVVELEPNNAIAHMNLGGIYKNLGNLDKALTSTLRSIELNPDNKGAVSNLTGIVNQLKINQSNAKCITQAYELLLRQTDVSHRKLTRIFLMAFLPTIQKASTTDPIVSESNQAFKSISTDWSFRKSLTLMVPPSPEIEKFLTRLRKEILILIKSRKVISSHIIHLTEALALQCFLNEYIYSSSRAEEDYVAQLINEANKDQETLNKSLAIIGCYKAIHATELSEEMINNYPTTAEISNELITAQFKEPRQEQKIKISLNDTYITTGINSKLVQEMYEKNPYPRFRFANYTNRELAEPIANAIKRETTKNIQFFPKELKYLVASPKILIAGCGTGNQVISASRYKNAEITAIDLSSSSLAYAIRKTKEYGMDNVAFKKMDLLNAHELKDQFDIIESSGVLHHMEKPDEGLSALTQQLKSGGYIKLGLYSKIARKCITKARKIIEKTKIKSTPEGIRSFRKKVLEGEIPELQDLPNFGGDFYSLSECRDLCFHVKEHSFTTVKLQILLKAHNLNFCGFIIPEKIKEIYKKQFPEDTDMTSLDNWGIFEKENSSTFKSMYQFWAQKN